jgi:hypothetical protein
MNDTAFRKSMTGSDAAVTREEALAWLTVNKQAVDDVMTSAANNMFIQKGYRENIFDLFNGFDKSKVYDIWSESARPTVQEIILKHSRNVKKAPATLWSEMLAMHDELAVLAKDTKNLAIKDVPVTDIVAKSGGKLPQELQIGSYYRAEAGRAVSEAVDNIVNNELMKIAPSDLIEDPRDFREAVKNRLLSIP